MNIVYTGVYIHIYYIYLLCVVWCPFSTPILVQNTHFERKSATSLGKRPSPALKGQHAKRSWRAGFNLFCPLLWSATLNRGKGTVFTHGNQKQTETKYPRYIFSLKRGKQGLFVCFIKLYSIQNITQSFPQVCCRTPGNGLQVPPHRHKAVGRSQQHPSKGTKREQSQPRTPPKRYAMCASDHSNETLVTVLP